MFYYFFIIFFIDYLEIHPDFGNGNQEMYPDYIHFSVLLGLPPSCDSPPPPKKKEKEEEGEKKQYE